MRIRRQGGRFVELRVRGHAGLAPAGQDVACAGVSALVLSAAYGLRRHCRASVDLTDHPAGEFTLRTRGGGTAAAAVLNTAVSGLRAIARSYPGYVKVTITRDG
ncbi:MAG: ribosomal-processing cysteine protease Prp [Candidatus Eremiobacteraeota bacterium]|nr:ribosomal-processing cysteine protease Prp [Candidatus Eremiobacteraeota bacterium]MBC5828108.1 ribosomal-processing cysteine protease Prp [Candidatus Eremiobacteraeota bacterium]